MPTFTFTGPQDLMGVQGAVFRRDEPSDVTDEAVIAELREHGRFIEAAPDFNGADPEKFDHDRKDGPGGSLPKAKRKSAKKAKA